jgi:hypothetical protein
MSLYRSTRCLPSPPFPDDNEYQRRSSPDAAIFLLMPLHYKIIPAGSRSTETRSGRRCHAKTSCTLIRYQLTLNPTSLQLSISRVDPQDLSPQHPDLGKFLGISYAGHLNSYCLDKSAISTSSLVRSRICMKPRI